MKVLRFLKMPCTMKKYKSYNKERAESFKPSIYSGRPERKRGNRYYGILNYRKTTAMQERKLLFLF